MAVVAMRKVGIVAHRSVFGKLTSRLAELGVVQISTREERLTESGRELESRISDIESARTFLASKIAKKAKPLKLSYKSLVDLAEKFPLEKTISGIDNIHHSIDDLSGREQSIEKAIFAVAPFSPLPVSFVDLASMSDVHSRVGFIPKALHAGFSENCPDELCEYQIFNSDSNGNYVLIVFHKSIESEIDELLSSCDFAEFHPGKRTGLPADELRKFRSELSVVKESLEAAKKESRYAAGEYLPTLDALYGYFDMELSKARLSDLAERTEQTLLLTGWVKSFDFDGLFETISHEFDAVDLDQISPDEGEAPPVALKNPPVIEAFEVITDLYGRPRAGMIDPTPFIAPFFPLFFALCLTDAGYGLLLTAISGAGLAFGKLGAGARKFMRFILYSGIATVIIGAFAGGWFGIDLASMDNGFSRALLSIKLFDPLGNAIEFFAASIFLGVIQVSTGYILSGVVGFREAPNGALKIRAALLAISWISVTIGAGVFVTNFLIPDTIAPFIKVAVNMLKFGALGIAGFSLILGVIGRRGLGSSIGDGLGFDGLYGIVNLFGDLLSYARILALGLSTGVIAGVINIIAKQIIEMLPGAGIVIAAFLVIVGHVAYTGISALGAFVHPARLHFVEYFGKFYEAGGEPFEPFKRKIDGVEIVE